MSDCRFGVSPVNYPDPDPDHQFATYPNTCNAVLGILSSKQFSRSVSISDEIRMNKSYINKPFVRIRKVGKV